MRNILHLFLVVALGCSAVVVGSSRAEEGNAPPAPQRDPKTPNASINFFSTGPQVPGVEYEIKLVIEVEDSTTKFEHDATFSAGSSGGSQAFFFGAVLKDEDGWKYEVKDDALVIEGWRDPKTGRVHRVKKIDVETDLPKEYKPKVQLPKKA